MSNPNKALTMAIFIVLYAAWRFSTRYMSEATERIVMFGFASVLVLVLIVWGFLKTSRDARGSGVDEDQRATDS